MSRVAPSRIVIKVVCRCREQMGNRVRCDGNQLATTKLQSEYAHGHRPHATKKSKANVKAKSSIRSSTVHASCAPGRGRLTSLSLSLSLTLSLKSHGPHGPPRPIVSFVRVASRMAATRCPSTHLSVRFHTVRFGCRVPGGLHSETHSAKNDARGRARPGARADAAALACAGSLVGAAG